MLAGEGVRILLSILRDSITGNCRKCKIIVTRNKAGIILVNTVGSTGYTVHISHFPTLAPQNFSE